MDDVSTVFSVTSIEAHVAIFAVVNVVAGAICSVVLVGKHARDLALEFFEFGFYVGEHFGIREAEIFESLGVSVFGIGLVENIKFFVAEAYATCAVFAAAEVV